MELSTAAPKAPKRQETLGPTSPIQDWEVERATVRNIYCYKMKMSVTYFQC